MLTLYHKPRTRSDSIVWLLDELGVSYRTQVVNLRNADGTGARDPINPHPHGKVPCLMDDGDLVFETSAIALHLTDKYRNPPLGPAVGEAHRGEYVSWLAYRAGVMEPALICRRFGVDHVFGAMGWAPAQEVEHVLNAHLGGRTWFVGETFTALDVLIGGGIHFMMMAGMMARTPTLEAYTAKLIARPTFQAMMARGSG